MYKITLTARSASGEEVASAEREVRVRAVRRISLRAIAPEITAGAGERARHVVRISNLGNTTGIFRFSAESTPDWKVELRPPEVTLAPSGSAEVLALVSIPSSVPGGGIHLLRVTAAEQGAGEETPASAGAQFRTLVESRRMPESRYPRLPLEAEITAAGLGPGDGTADVRILSSGPVSGSTHLDLDADLLSDVDGGRMGELRARHARARVAGSRWDLAFGDVTREFPDIAGLNLSGRGVSLRAENDLWRVRLLAGRDPDVPSAGAFGFGTERALARLRLGTDLLLRDEEIGILGIRKSRLACLSAALEPDPATRLTLETAASRTDFQHRVTEGAGGQLFLQREGARLQLRTRAYTGTAGFGGRTRDRSGVSGYGLYTPSSRVRFWTNVEGVSGRIWDIPGSARETSGRLRAGVRLSPPVWPVLELTAGASSDRVDSDSLQSVDRGEVSLAVTRSLGPLTGSTSARIGRAWNPFVSRSGAIGGIDVNLGARTLGFSAILRWDRQWDQAPGFEAGTRTTSLAGDLLWGSGALSAGVGVSRQGSDAGRAGYGSGRDVRLLPRVEAQILSRLRLRCEAGFFGADHRPRPSQWQIQLAYAGSELLPVVWHPVRGTLAAVVFVDADGDGEPDPKEERIARVVFMIDGRHAVSDEKGALEWPAMEPGTYWLELDRSSLPPGVSPRVRFPIEVRVEAGQTVPVYVPLVRNGEIQGRVYRERDGDGHPSAGEEGIGEIQVLLLGPSGRVAECLTDASGGYRFAEVPPGLYKVRIAEEWLPSDWTTVPDRGLEAQVGPGAKVALAPLGAAPRMRPVRITYHGGLPR